MPFSMVLDCLVEVPGEVSWRIEPDEDGYDTWAPEKR
jgi:hypothetical protein